MRNRTRNVGGTVYIGLLLLLLISPSVHAGTNTDSTITLEQPAQFIAGDGSVVQVHAGSYRIEQAGATRLRLTREGSATIELDAVPSAHKETVSTPTALAVVEEGKDDQLHLVLILPDGHALDAIGSYSGIQSRATFSAPLKAMQLQNAMTQVQARPPTPQPAPSPILRVPAGTASAVKQPVKVALGPGKWISWPYLQINHPELVAQALADVQAGRRPRSFVAGLATPMELNEMLKTNWAAEVARLNAARQAAVTTRGPTAPRPPSPVQREASMASISLLPIPAQDLGATYSGEIHAHTFSVSAPASGYLRAQLNIEDVRSKRFRIHRVVAYTGEFVNGVPQVYRQANGGEWDDIRPSGDNPSVRVSMAGSVVLDVKKGQRVDIVVAFEPHASIGPPVGRYDVPLQLTWHASTTGRVGSQTVWLRAYCNGIHFGLMAYAEQASAITLTGGSVDYPVVLTNSSATPIAGSFSPPQLPPGVTMNPASLTIAPNSSQRAILRFNVNDQLAQDGPNQDIVVVFNSGAGNRTINLSISIYHPWVWWCGPWDTSGCLENSGDYLPPLGGPGADHFMVWIKNDGTWWWRISTYYSPSFCISVGGADFDAVLTFNGNQAVKDRIPVHIGPCTSNQIYERTNVNAWIHNSFLTAADQGIDFQVEIK